MMQQIHDQAVIFRCLWGVIHCSSNADYSSDIDSNAGGDTLILSDNDV